MKDCSWVGTWSASPQPVWGPDFVFPTKIPADACNQTIRQVVRVSVGGSKVRVIFANDYGGTPLKIGAASVAIADIGAAIRPDTLHMLTFGGDTEAMLPAGAPLVSDTVDLVIEDGEQLSISLYLPEKTPLATFHWDGGQTAYLGSGDLTSHGAFPSAETTDARILLSGVRVNAPNNGAVVVFGDSITDGAGAIVDADTRWTDYLARRLAPRRVSVLNAGISGARLLQDKMGANAAARFTRDVLAQPRVKAAILLLGINDIGWPGTAFARGHVQHSAAALIAAYRQLIAMAHAQNVRIIGATLTPFRGALAETPLDDYWQPEKDALREQVNHWIRTCGAFDAVVDFDALLRDPAYPSRLAAPFDSGDHLHPGACGHQAMAQGIDLDALLGSSISQS